MDELGFVDKLKAWWWYRKYKWGFWKVFKSLDGKRKHEVYKYKIQLETIEQIAKYITDGGGSFRVFTYGYLKIHYVDSQLAGGLIISNAICTEEKCPLLLNPVAFKSKIK